MWLVPQKLFRFVDRCKRMGDISNPVGPVNDFNLFDFGVELGQKLLQIANQLVQCRAVPEGGVVDGINGLGISGCHGQQVHLYHVVDVGEIARILTVAIDQRRVMVYQLLSQTAG